MSPLEMLRASNSESPWRVIVWPLVLPDVRVPCLSIHLKPTFPASVLSKSRSAVIIAGYDLLAP